MDLMELFASTPPEYLTGLLGQDKVDALKQKSSTAGLLNTVLSYAAQPKTQGYGSPLPYLANAFLAGRKASGDVYDQATEDYSTQQKLNTLKANEESLKTLLAMPEVINSPTYQMLARTNPAKLIEILNPQRTTTTIDNQLVEYDPASRTAKSLFGQPKIDTKEIDRGDRVDLINNRTGELITSFKKSAAPQNKELWSNTPVTDEKGRSIYLPTAYGSMNGKKPIDAATGAVITDYAPTRTKPVLPPAIQKAEDADYESITSANTLVDATNGMISSLAKGNIPMSVLGRAGAATSSFTGLGADSPEVIAYKDYGRFKNKLVTESLRLNKGTQTENDAFRAAKDFESASSPQDAIAALTQLNWYNSQAIENASKNVLRRRKNSGLPAPEVMPEKPKSQVVEIPNGIEGVTLLTRLPETFLKKAAIKLPETINDQKLIYDKLPKGARYVDVDASGQPIMNADGSFRIAVKQ
jgi:hypothetical protein